MSFLALGFAISFLGVLGMDFPLMLISLGVVERSLLLWVASVVVGAGGGVLGLVLWGNGGLTFLKLLILVFHFTLVIHIFCPLGLGLLLVILCEVSGIFVWTVFWFRRMGCWRCCSCLTIVLY